MASVSVTLGEGCRTKPEATPLDAAEEPPTRVCLKAPVNQHGEDEPIAVPAGCLTPALPSDAHLGPSGEVTISSVTGSTISNVDAVLARNRFRFRVCYRQALAEDASIKGSVTLEAAVNVDGSVENAAIAKGSTLPPGLTACLAKTFMAMLFDAPKGGATKFSVTLTLAPAK